MITASIVTYNNPLDELELAINCVLKSELGVYLYISDNSNTKRIKQLCDNKRVEYIYNNKNIGFGAAHNIAIIKAIEKNSKYHFVINPDVEFNPDVIKNMVEKMEQDSHIGLMMPMVLNADGTIQLLPKLLPTPFNLFIRVFKPLSVVFSRYNHMYNLSDYYNKELNVPIISGCFTLINIKNCIQTGFYDESFFMYFEDFDFSRRVHREFKTLYYPKVKIIHKYERGASKSFKLFKIFTKSAITYFNKYGWFLDKKRKIINRNTINNLKA